MSSNWTNRLSAAPSFEMTSLLDESQQQQLTDATRRWGDEAKAWRDQHTGAGKLPHELKNEISYLDNTPRSSCVTVMDRKLGADITAFLANLTPGIPVINEEASAEENQRILHQAKADAAAKGHAGPTYWVIDPIDGTDNFVDPNKREYSVLIGLVENGEPRFGITYYPEFDQLNVTRGTQAIGIHRGQETVLKVQPFTPLDRKGQTTKLEISPNIVKAMRKKILPQDTELSERLDAMSIRTNCQVGGIDPVTRTSFNYDGDYPNDQLVLDGRAHLSGFIKGAFEWDYAARQAILRAAGGEMLLKETGLPPRYGENDNLYLRPIWLGHPATLEQIGVAGPSASCDRAPGALAR